MNQQAPRKFLTWLILTALVLSISACATKPGKGIHSFLNGAIEIRQEFAVDVVGEKNLGAVYQACLGTELAQGIRTEMLKDISKKSMSITRNTAHSRYLLLTAHLATCIQETSRGFPVLATEVFNKTVEPAGVPEPTLNQWYERIAHTLAKEGHAEVAYQFPSGNAHRVRYWTDIRFRGFFFYEASFVPEKDFKPSNFDFVFTHPELNGVVTSRWGDSGPDVYQRKPFLHHRFVTVEKQP